MALIDCKDPVFDRHVDKILEMLEDGIDRVEIASTLGYKNPMSLDNYMRRHNFSWNSRQKNFVPAAERYSGRVQDDSLQLHGTPKAALIVSLFGQGESDAKKIARMVGLDSHTEMANYMKRKGYEWSSEQANYIETSAVKTPDAQPTEGPDRNASISEMLEKIIPLLQNKQSIDNPSSGEMPSMPRYQVKGMYGTKAMRMANVLDEMTRRFSKERNISQREIIEVALIEFFQKYGKRNEIDVCLVDV